MHGRLKVRTSAEEAARKKKEQELKVKAYRAGMARIFEKRERQELDDEMLLITGQILSRNPDVYTLWNIRKECILKLSQDQDDDESKQGTYDKDLGFTEQCLMVNPKSYGAWHHRCWVLENCPTPNWDREVALCTKYLKLDERNFHCWDYRRFVIGKAEIPPEKELEFCTEKIRNNFSNYSSWHYRSKLLPLLHPHETNPLRPISEAKLKEELEMVLTAAFTDPNDSSAWFYQRWLLGYSLPALDIASVRISHNLAVISFTKPVDIQTYTISSNLGVELNSTDWRPVCKNSKHDSTWILSDSLRINPVDSKCTLKCKSNDGQEFFIALKKCTDGFYAIKSPKFEYEFGAAVLEELRNQLDSCNQLLEYEPDSKWTLLTASLLMRAVDRTGYHTKSLEYLKRLEKIDHLRRGYYADLASKWAIEKQLEEWIVKGNIAAKLDLSDLSLTTIFYEQYMCVAEDINLDTNCLSDRSAAKLNAFQFCKNLDLSRNEFSTPVSIPHLPNLKMLTLEENNFSSKEMVDELGSRLKRQL